MCRWVSIIPGMTMPPAASTSNVSSGTSSAGPTASIRSPTTRTSPSSMIRCASSIVRTVPRRKTTGRPGSGVEAFVLTGLLRVGSWNEDRLRAAGGLPLTLPGGGDVFERAPVDVDLDVAVGGVRGQAQIRVALDVERGVRDREAAHVERQRADE